MYRRQHMENNTEFTLPPQSLEVGIAKLASLDIMSMNKAMSIIFWHTYL